MKLSCPKCGGVNTDPQFVEGMVRCTGCGEWFKPDIQSLQEQPQAASPTPVSTELSEAEKVLNLADGLVGWSIFFLVIGVLCLFVDLFVFLQGGGADALTVLFVACGAFGLSFWFFLAGQIVHIRALLAKK